MTPLDRVRNRSAQLARPLTASLELTYVCNWRCVFCYNPRHADIRRMNAREWIEVIDDLQSLGTLTVTFTGGEPLTHPDFLTIARAARDRGLAVRIFTNGTLVTEEMADAIAALLPVAVEMSLHGADAETHDAATAKPGSFVALLAGVERLRRRGVRLLLKSLLTRINEHQMPAISKLAESFGAEHQFDSTVTPRDDGSMEPLQYSSSPEGVKRLEQIRRDTGKAIEIDRASLDSNCGLGRATLAIDPEGNVYPCMQWRHRAVGNVRQSRLLDLWHSSPARLEAANIATEANVMLRELGGELSRASFCPALAVEQTGDPLSLYPEFLERVASMAARRPENNQTIAAQ